MYSISNIYIYIYIYIRCSSRVANKCVELWCSLTQGNTRETNEAVLDKQRQTSNATQEWELSSAVSACRMKRSPMGETEGSPIIHIVVIATVIVIISIMIITIFTIVTIITIIIIISSSSMETDVSCYVGESRGCCVHGGLQCAYQVVNGLLCVMFAGSQVQRMHVHARMKHIYIYIYMYIHTLL